MEPQIDADLHRLNGRGVARLGSKHESFVLEAGRPKVEKYRAMKSLIESSVGALVLIGEDADNIESQLKGITEIIRASSVEDAVRKCFDAAKPKDSVLLAPAVERQPSHLCVKNRWPNSYQHPKSP